MALKDVMKKAVRRSAAEKTPIFKAPKYYARIGKTLSCAELREDILLRKAIKMGYIAVPKSPPDKPDCAWARSVRRWKELCVSAGVPFIWLEFDGNYFLGRCDLPEGCAFTADSADELRIALERVVTVKTLIGINDREVIIYEAPQDYMSQVGEILVEHALTWRMKRGRVERVEYRG